MRGLDFDFSLSAPFFPLYMMNIPPDLFIKEAPNYSLSLSLSLSQFIHNNTVLHLVDSPSIEYMVLHFLGALA
jgi:hypothetical protein